MANQTLLQIVQAVCRRVPLSSIPVSVIGNPSPQIQQILQITQDVGGDLMSNHEWEVLNTPFQYTTAVDPNYEPLPDDYDRLMVDSSLWRSDNRLYPATGPITPDKWYYLTNIPWTGFPGFWQLQRNTLASIGISIGVTCQIKYISHNWILNNDDVTRQEFWTADDDTPLLPWRLIYYGAAWRFKQMVGADFSVEEDMFNQQYQTAVAADRAARPIPTRRLFYGDSFGAGYAWPGQIITPP